MNINHPSDKTRQAGATPVEPIPSATLLMVRDGARGLEVLAVLRGQGVSFAKGAVAFPGGALESGDFRLARVLGLDDELAPFRLAAIRETFEETGLLLAHGQEGLTTAMLARPRELLLAGETDFATLMADHRLRPALEAMVHIAHWTTPRTYGKRFSTHFFLAQALGERDASHESGELDDTFWMCPAEAAEWNRDGRHKLMLPTLKTCARLARFATVAEAMAGMGFELGTTDSAV